jgi:hypothetical protein
MRSFRMFFPLLLFFFFLLPVSLQGQEPGPGAPRPEIMRTIFSGNETLHFSVSWTGGIKIGDLVLQLKEDDKGFVIHAKVTDYGLFRLFYPVDDDFITFVSGEDKLPYRYGVTQREGRGSQTTRLTDYDQQELVVTYRKNNMDEEVFPVAGPVYNEFSSFYITRTRDLQPGGDFMIPTFADRKRNEVKVEVREKEEIDSLFGRVMTVPVMPKMKFRGLYDKAGDTVIWLTDDLCRVPVRINSKILIGSLTAELVEYSNSACEKY